MSSKAALLHDLEKKRQELGEFAGNKTLGGCRKVGQMMSCAETPRGGLSFTWRSGVVQELGEPLKLASDSTRFLSSKTHPVTIFCSHQATGVLTINPRHEAGAREASSKQCEGAPQWVGQLAKGTKWIAITALWLCLTYACHLKNSKSQTRFWVWG